MGREFCDNIKMVKSKKFQFDECGSGRKSLIDITTHLSWCELIQIPESQDNLRGEVHYLVGKGLLENFNREIYLTEKGKQTYMKILEYAAKLIESQ